MSTVNANRPKGELSDSTTAWQIHDTDQIKTADQYRPIIVAYINGSRRSLERRCRTYRIRSKTFATPGSPTESPPCW